MKLSGNLLKKGIRGQRIISSPLNKFIQARQLDWAILITCAFLPLPSIATGSAALIYAKVVITFLIWFIAKDYIDHYAHLLREEKVFSDALEPFHGKTKPDKYDIHAAAKLLKEDGFAFGGIETFLKFLNDNKELIEDITKQENIEVQTIVDRLLQKNSPEEVQKQMEVFLALSAAANKIGGWNNLMVTTISINRTRRVDSIYGELYDRLQALIFLTVVFFATETGFRLYEIFCKNP